MIANKQPKERESTLNTAKREELSKIPKHAKFVLDFSSINQFNNN